jgi:hypothetical protein
MNFAPEGSWKPLQLLVWVASRDRSLADWYSGTYFVQDAERALHEWRKMRDPHPPNLITIAEAFDEVCGRYNSLTPHTGD